ncbi:hypothetical protein TRVL_04287 [Trypanosoma vivax]|nr:hypothetical protein TRVL_04287 [Trypanosoma vivax]
MPCSFAASTPGSPKVVAQQSQLYSPFAAFRLFVTLRLSPFSLRPCSVTFPPFSIPVDIFFPLTCPIRVEAPLLPSCRPFRSPTPTLAKASTASFCALQPAHKCQCTTLSNCSRATLPHLCSEKAPNEIKNHAPSTFPPPPALAHPTAPPRLCSAIRKVSFRSHLACRLAHCGEHSPPSTLPRSCAKLSASVPR